MATNSPLVIGVFQQEADAKSALKTLQDAGFVTEQLGLALRKEDTVSHTLLRDLVKLGVPQDHALYYESEYKAGHPVVSVRADGREQEAAQVMQQYGASLQSAQNSPSAQTTTSTSAGAAMPYESAARADTVDHEEVGSLRLREEQLNVDKQRVQSGEVRLHKEVVEEQRSIDVPVTHEEVFIQRHAINDGRVSDAPIGQDETIRIPVLEEQVNVTKTPVVTEEVAIGKRAVQEKQQVTDTVRREEARLERDGDTPIHGESDLRNS